MKIATVSMAFVITGLAVWGCVEEDPVGMGFQGSFVTRQPPPAIQTASSSTATFTPNVSTTTSKPCVFVCLDMKETATPALKPIPASNRREEAAMSMPDACTVQEW